MKRFSLILIASVIPLLFLFTTCEKDNHEPEEEATNTITVGVSGGGFDLKNGLHLEVPPGAVDGDTEISLELVDYSKYSSQQVNPTAETNLLVAFEGYPDGMAFNEPITVIASGIDIPAGKIAILKELSSTVQPLPDATLEYNAESQELKITLDHFSAKSSEAMDAYAAAYCAKDPCRCISHHVEQRDGDNVCDNGSCQVVESIVEAIYPACSKIPELSIFREVTPGCQASISVEAASNEIPPGGSTEITATTELGCVIIENQSVDFVYDALGSVDPTYAESDSEGKARTTFTAGEELGTSTITANSTISYYSSYIEANGEVYKGDLKTTPASASIQIVVAEQEQTWKGHFHSVFNGNFYYHRFEDYTYDADFSFTIMPGDWGKGVSSGPGNITISQGGIVTAGSTCDGCWVEDLFIMNTSSNSFSVLLDKEEKTISFLPEPHENAIVLSFEIWKVIGTLGEQLVNIEELNCPYAYRADTLTRPPFKIVVDGETLSQSGTPVFDYHHGEYSFTLTLQN